MAARASDSASTDTTTEVVLKPSARRVAISRDRVETAVHIVRTAPKTAPMPISAAMANPSPRMSALRACDCCA
ncbi:MAG: hypothetical protein R2712_01780 [Vicinamibacterales bacterium]